MKLNVYGYTDPGLVRDRNEDSYFYPGWREKRSMIEVVMTIFQLLWLKYRTILQPEKQEFMSLDNSRNSLIDIRAVKGTENS